MEMARFKTWEILGEGELNIEENSYYIDTR